MELAGKCVASVLCDKWKCAKTIGWRCLATMDTFIIVFVVDKSVETASKVAVTEVITKFLLYYVYEHLTEFMGKQYDKRCGGAIVECQNDEIDDGETVTKQEA